MKSVALSEHLELIDSYEEQFDGELQLLKINCVSRGTHSMLGTGIRHPIRESIEYAVALLDGGRKDDIQRATGIIRKVLSLQDKNSENETFGLWSYYYEEPLSQMAPPDWNWADFCGKYLLQVLIDHKDKMDVELIEGIRTAVICASKSIIKRNIGMHYTNIAAMGTYVTLVTGALLKNDEIYDYGKNRLQRLLAFTDTLNSFYEFNSPSYTMLLAEDLALMKQHFKDTDCLRMVDELIDRAWHCIATHFHQSTNQWSGPHSRCYDDFLTSETLTKFEVALNNSIYLTDTKRISLSSYRNNVECPSKYREYFSSERKEYYSQTMNSRGFNYPFFAFPQVATTYMTEEFTLGSFNRSEFWNQIRPLISYFGTKENPKCFRIKCLHDFYDYSSAEIHCIQNYGSVLGHINFASNRGDTHVSLDTIKNATIKAKDLRIRFQLEGDSDSAAFTHNKNSFAIKSDDVYINIEIPYCKFDNYNVECISTKEDGMIFLDIILYSGSEKEINFEKIDEAICAFGLNISSEEKVLKDICCYKEKDNLISVWNVENTELKVESNFKPLPFSWLMLNDRQYINGELIEDRVN